MDHPPNGDKGTANKKRKILGEDGLTKGQRRRQGRKKRKEEQLRKEEEERMKAKHQLGVETTNCAAPAAPVAVVNEALARGLAKNQRKSERKRKEREEAEEKRRKNMQEVEDQCSGLRNNTVTKLNRSFTEEQAKNIGSAMIGNSSLRELILHFYHWSFSPDLIPHLTLPGAQALCEGILRSKLKELWLCDNITDPQIRQCLYQAVAGSPSLEVLSVSFHQHDALDHENVIALSQALMNNTSIRELAFHVGCQLTETGAEALALGIQHSQLERLKVKCSDADYSFDRYPPPSDVPFITLFEAIQHKMQSLDVLTVAEFGRQVPFTCIADGLQTTTSLKELIFKNAKLGVDDIHVLGTGLSQNNSIKILRLVGTSIDDAGLTELASHLHHDSCLQELHFDAEPDRVENEFGPVGLQALVAAVENMPALRTLNVSSNENIGYRGWKIIGDALPNLTLRELDLRFYPEEDYEDSDVEATEPYDSARQALLEGMRANEHVWKILVHVGAFGRQDLFDEMYFYSDRNLWGRRLLTVDHGLSPTIWCYILERGQQGNPNESFHDAKNGPSIIYYILREQPNLVQPLRYV